MAQKINVNTTPGQFMPTLYYSQGDVGRVFEIALASSDGWSIPSGATVEMVATKPSGFGFTVSGTLTDNVASFTTTETMTNEWGRFPAEIRITSGGDVIGTANFYLSGEKDPHPAETIDGDAGEIIPELTLLVERVEAAASSVLDMTVNANTLAAGSQATYSYDEETNTATFGIPQGEAGAGSVDVVASAYSSSKTYAVGDYVIHNSNLYRCTTAITTAESFTAGHWTQAVLADDVTDLKSDLSNVQNLVNPNLLENVTWAVGSINIDNGSNTDSSTRVRSVEYIPVKSGDKIYAQIDSGYKYAFDWFNSSKAVNRVGIHGIWQSINQTITVPDDTAYCRVLLATSSDGTVDTSISSHFEASLTTTIVDVVTKLKDNVFVNINNVSGIDLKWEIGTFNSSSGEEMAGNNRARSGFIKVGKGTTLELKNSTTYNHLLYLFDLNHNFISAGQWLSTRIDIEQDCYIRMLVRYASNATITDETLPTVASQEIINYVQPFAEVFNDLSPSIYSIEENKKKKHEVEVFKQKKTNAEGYGQCDAKLLFYTDVHGDKTRTARLKELVNNWGTSYFDLAICGGDIAQLIISEDLTWYYNALSDMVIPYVNTVGNHDAWSNLDGTLAPQTTVYNKIIAPTVSNSGITQPSGASTNGYNYYYKDIGGTVRLIVLDCMYWDATQLDWLVSTLESARSGGLHVLCVSHAAFPLANMEDVDCLWSKSDVNTDSVRTSLQACGAVKDFEDAGGVFIAWVVGHQHGDYVHKLPDYNNQFVVNLGSFAQRAGFLLKSTDPTAYNYDCLTFIAVDTSNRNIRFMRIGADIDIYGTKHNGLVINYNTDELISSW